MLAHCHMTDDTVAGTPGWGGVGECVLQRVSCVVLRAGRTAAMPDNKGKGRGNHAAAVCGRWGAQYQCQEVPPVRFLTSRCTRQWARHAGGPPGRGECIDRVGK